MNKHLEYYYTSIQESQKTNTAFDHLVYEGSQKQKTYYIRSKKRKAGNPTFIFTGCIHGIERVGFECTKNILELLQKSKTERQERVNVVGIPIVNLRGYSHGKRANRNGVDLMRNAPIESKASSLLIGGQRLSKYLPFFQGTKNKLETENKMINEIIQQHHKNSPCTLYIDIHSGPFKEPLLRLPYNLKKRTKTRPYYQILQRMLNDLPGVKIKKPLYGANGDMTDWLFEKTNKKGSLFIPLTLEIAAQPWIKKMGRKFFSSPYKYLYNPPKNYKREKEYMIPMKHFLQALELFEQSIRN